MKEAVHKAKKRIGPFGRGIGLSTGLFLLIGAINWNTRHLPYHWDALGYVFPHAREIYEANLFPILRRWDVGHPTGFFFLLAVSMKIFGQGPFAGHVLTWACTSLLLTAVYGICRVLEIPRRLTALCAALVFCYPMVFAATRQVLLEIPMSAFLFLALLSWVRRRWVCYFLFASMAILTKFFGFLLLCGPFAALLLRCGALWEKETRRPFLKTLGLTLTPLLSLLAFLMIRQLVRGPGMTIGFTPTQQLNPLWRLGEFRGNLGQAIEILYVQARLHQVLALTALTLLCCVFAGIWRKRHARQERLWFDSDDARMLFIVLAAFLVGANAAFLQCSNLMARHNTVTLVGILILFVFGIWQIFRRVLPAVLILVSILAVFPFFWYPQSGNLLPRLLSVWLRTRPVSAGHLFELDLRFQDILELMQWAPQRVTEDAERHNPPLRPAIATQWPMFIAYCIPEMGYVDKAIPTSNSTSWEKINPDLFPYVLELKPITSFGPAKPEDFFDLRLVEAKKRGDAEAILWHVRPRSSPPPPAPAR